MFCRVEILKRPRDQVICAHYKIANVVTEFDEYAERERRTHGGDGYRIENLHTGEVREAWG
jgi:hypothetical protein